MFGDVALDGAEFHFPDFVPFGAGKADGREAAAGEEDAAVVVISRVVLVLPQDWKLDAADGAEFFQRENISPKAM